MINFKTYRRKWLESTPTKAIVDTHDYIKHFQLALINLEQNLIEERLPELKKSA